MPIRGALMLCFLYAAPVLAFVRSGLASSTRSKRVRSVGCIEFPAEAFLTASALLAGSALFARVLPGGGVDDQVDDLTRRGMRDVITTSSSSSRPPAPPLAPPVSSCITGVGRDRLLPLTRKKGFTDAWIDTLGAAGRVADQSHLIDASIGLQTRIEQVRSLAEQRRVMADALITASERCFFETAELRLLESAKDIAPGATLPFDAANLMRISQHLPGQSARQARSMVLESAPSDDATLNGRFDRLQAARLYLGHIQFGYFLSQIFRGQASLDENQRLTAEEAKAITDAIQLTAKQMKSEAAWVAASRRAGVFFQLPWIGPNDAPRAAAISAATFDDSLGYEQLRTFTASVQIVSAAQQTEFFQPDVGESSADEGAPSVLPAASAVPTVDELPSAEFVAFNAAGLQALLAEGCLYGWHLWGAEAGARAQLVQAGVGEEAIDELLTPPRVEDVQLETEL
mmetsp:Transcript_14089/g.36460  ORF Transcript_14089/g.36460 Transcript_14089/m.36460 type:complete len:458 (-) Transcript_14089:138-1511(-)